MEGALFSLSAAVSVGTHRGQPSWELCPFSWCRCGVNAQGIWVHSRTKPGAWLWRGMERERCGAGDDGFPHRPIPVVLPRRNLLLRTQMPTLADTRAVLQDSQADRMPTVPCPARGSAPGNPHPSPQPLPSPLTLRMPRKQSTFGKSLCLWQQCHHP